MNEFDQRTRTLEVDLYGFGPWVLSQDTMVNFQHTWVPIAADWVGAFNKIIIDRVPRKTVAVQAGGWQGVYPFLLSNMFERVYTFEPDPINFHCLTRNCQRHNIYKFQAALSNKNGLVTFEETESSGQHRVVHDRHEMFDMRVYGKVTVPAMSVDSLDLDELGFMMIDVENYENQVIEGALGTIEKFKPVICAEKSFIEDNDDKLQSMLAQFGYKRIVDMQSNMFFSVDSAK